MKAEREDRLESHGARGGFPMKLLVLVVAAIIVVYLLWQSFKQDSSTPVLEPAVVEEVAVVEPELPPAEDIPTRVVPEPEAPPQQVVEESEPAPAPPPVLPALEDSDPFVREQFAAAAAGAELAKLQQQQNLVEQGAAIIDGLSRGLILRKILPLDPPEGDFSVQQQGDKMLIDPAGYDRYDAYAGAIAALDSAALVNSFHTLRPLYEQAYSQLGLPADEFDNAVIRVLDRILATPEIEAPIELTRKSVMYQYADPQLEGLTPLQKQLLRMGPANIRQIKTQAAALRAGLLSPQ